MGAIKVLSVYLTHSFIWRSLSNLIYIQASLPLSRFVTNKLDSLVVHFYVFALAKCCTQLLFEIM